MLRRVVSHPLFYIVLLVGCIALFFSVRDVNGGSWFRLWTAQKHVAPVYKQKSFIDNSVIGVTMLHLELTSSAAGATDISFVQAVDVLQQADTLLANNFISYLQNATDKRRALIAYTRNVDKIIAEADLVRNTLSLERDSVSQEYQQCVSDKSAADNQFFQGLTSIDGGLLQNGYDESLRAGTCETTSRISMNAYQAILTRLQGYTNALTQLSTLLTENEDLIVANIDLFRDDYLERLIQIRDNLNIVTRSSALD